MEGYENSGANEEKDIQENKAMAILAYIIFLIPLIAAKDSKFARYHTNQGLLLFLLTVGWNIIYSIISSVLYAISYGLGMTIGSILGIANLGILALAIIGIMNACKGEEKPLPIIGSITIIK